MVGALSSLGTPSARSHVEYVRAQIVRSAARDASAVARARERLTELRPRHEEAPIAALGVLEREVEHELTPSELRTRSRAITLEPGQHVREQLSRRTAASANGATAQARVSGTRGVGCSEWCGSGAAVHSEG
jgi:hypothetical protein